MQKKKNNSLRGLIYLLSFIIFVSLGLFAVGLQMKWWSFGSNLITIDVFKTKDTDVDAEFSIGYGNHENLVTSQGNVVGFMDGYLVWVNTKGDIVQRSSVKLDFPFLKASGDYVMAAERNGNKVVVYKGRKMAWSADTEDSILNADINKFGYVTLVRNYTGYKSALEVYDNKGTVRYLACRADNMIVNASVLSDKHTLVINSLNTNGCALETSIEFCDLNDNEGKVNKSHRINNAMFYKLESLGNGKIALGSSDRVIIYNKKGKALYDTEYSHVQGLSAVNNKMIAVSGIQENKTHASGHLIQFITADGQVKNTLDLGATIKSMKAYSGTVAVSLGRKAIVLNAHGAILGTATSNAEIIDLIYLRPGKILLVTSDAIKICKY